MNSHFEQMRGQCPNLLETQLGKYKKEWSKYLRYKPLNLSNFSNLLDKVIESVKGEKLEEFTELVESIDN